MKLAHDKCPHLIIEKRQIKSNGQHLEMDGVKIQQVDGGECYKYLGQEKVSREYFTRVTTICKS